MVVIRQFLEIIMCAAQSSSEFRIFGIDIGVNNMGMASIVLTGGGKTVVEKLDWRPLIARRGTANAGLIVDAVGFYISTITTPEPNSPFTGNLVNGMIVPNKVIIEQQYASNGINVHALEIQVALMSRLAERFPGTLVTIAGASARKCKSSTKDQQKDRAKAVASMFIGLDSVYWATYFGNLSDPQHVCDATTMILDDINYQNLPGLRAELTKWEQQRQVPVLPVEAKATVRRTRKAK